MVMTDNKGSSEMSNDDQSSSELYPYPFTFRSRDELNEHISTKLRHNRVAYNTKVVLGLFTLILPLFNVFTVYRSMIYQREDFADVYSVFHSLIFYGEFALVHLLLIGTFILFIVQKVKEGKSSGSSKGQWINLFDLEFTLMAFNLIKLIPIFAVNGFNFLFKEISLIGIMSSKYSRSSRIIAFTAVIFAVVIQSIILTILLVFITLIKVYQVSFVGEVMNPLQWTINQWLLFIGFAANIINITDIPTVSQLSCMWDITNQNWSNDSSAWSNDKLAFKRKVYIFERIHQSIGFVKGFLWVRTMSAIDLHSLVRLPSSDNDHSEEV